MAVSALGTINGRLAASSVAPLSSANPSDDFNLTLRSAGSLNLNFGGLSSGTKVVLRSSSGAPDKKAQVGSEDVVFKGLDKGAYTVHVELPTDNNPPGSGSGGTSGSGSGTGGMGSGGSGGSGSGGTSGSGTGIGTGTPGTVLHKIVRLDFAGSVTQLSPLTSYQNQTGTGYAPNGLGLGSAVSGTVDVDLYQSSVVTSFIFNGQSLGADPSRSGYLGELTAGAAIAQGWSSDPSIGLVTLNTFLLNYSSPLTTPGIKVAGSLNTQPLAPGLPYTTGGNTPYLGASSDNIVFTTVGEISSSGSGTGTGAGTGSSGGTGSTGTGTGTGTGSTGSGSAGGTGNTGNSSTPFTLTLTADYAGNDSTAADTEITSVSTKDSSRYIKAASTGVLQDFVGSSDTKDYYRFQVNTASDNTHSGTNVSVKLKGLAANVSVQFLDSMGKELASTTVISGKDGSLEHIFGSGTYYVNVLPSGGDTNYTLDFTETPLTTNLTYATTPSTPFLTNLWEFDANGKNSTAGIDPNKPTVLIIHGWNNKSKAAQEYGNTSKELATLAKAIIKKNPSEQVLGLDWGQAAYQSSLSLLPPYDAAGRVKGVANWAVTELKELGIDPKKLTLIGHSFGSYVADEIGHIGGKVATLYALDPAGSFGFGNKLGIGDITLTHPYDLDAANGIKETPPPFNGAASKSYAFYGIKTLTDNPVNAATADYSFAVKLIGLPVLNVLGRLGTIHEAGIFALTDLVNRNLITSDLSSPIFKAPPTYRYYSDEGKWVKTGGTQSGFVQMAKFSNNWKIDSLEYDPLIDDTNKKGVVFDW